MISFENCRPFSVFLLDHSIKNPQPPAHLSTLAFAWAWFELAVRGGLLAPLSWLA